MTKLSYDRYCSEVLAQTALMRAALRGADLAATVPTCPDWTLAQLVLHVGRAHRFAESLVRTRTTEFEVRAEEFSAESGPGDPSPGDETALGGWLLAGAETLVSTLREAGADAPVWTFAESRTADFWARRMTHETAIHRADAQRTAGIEFTIDPEVAVDCLDEWLEMSTYPAVLERKPELKGLLGPGRTIHLHATDTPAEAAAEWFVDLTGERMAWRRGHEKAAVTVRGPVADVLAVFYHRQPIADGRVEVLGDRALLDLWLETASFG
ncbi:maleylpyruvate isomerase family mycothiol-dependent enzyme [Streptomyces sp. NPDC020379]|uniref:maleylpyruvate isomerase family mycothiol-dependent enzyme n=1 Tax=Streptomyces sp. NPDC020379 TaxID=3365071 RepID=UPI00379B7701